MILVVLNVLYTYVQWYCKTCAYLASVLRPSLSVTGEGALLLMVEAKVGREVILSLGRRGRGCEM